MNLFMKIHKTIRFIFHTYFNRDVLITNEIDPSLKHIAEGIFPDDIIIYLWIITNGHYLKSMP